MNGKILSEIMLTLLLTGTLAIFPVHATPAYGTPEIYMTPSSNPPYPGPYIGFKWTVTIWVKDYGSPPIYAWEVRLLYDPAAGINITGAWIPRSDSQYIFYGRRKIRGVPPVIGVGTVLFGDSLLDVSGSPPPYLISAKLAIIEFEITDAPGKFDEFYTDLVIWNMDTYLLDDTLNLVPVMITDGSYSYVRVWDITGSTQWVPDGKCDIRDLAIVAVRFGSKDGGGMYDSRADITGPTYLEKDGKIDIRDIVLVGVHFGEEY